MNSWNDRLKRLRRALDLNQDEMAVLLGVTREWVSKLEGGNATVSELLQRKIADEEGKANAKSVHVEEPPGDYRISGSLEHRAPAPLRPASPKMIDPDPRFQGPLSAEPTPQKCAEYFKEYLRRAATEPGGIGYAWVKLQKLFPLDEFEGRKKSS